MAKIYDGGQVTTAIPQPTFRADQLANSGVQETLDRAKQEALELYEQGLKVQTSQSMETLFSEYGNDPQALSEKLNELGQKMGSEIPDLGLRMSFKTNYILTSQSMINRAQANYDKIQYEKKRSSYFDTIQANNKSIQLAFENAFSGTATADDLVNYQTAINQNKALINARNEDGTYMFTDAQRLSMSTAIDKLASESFNNALVNMDDDKRNQFFANLENDNVVLLSAEDDDKNVRQLNLKDAVDSTVYADMKKSAKNMDLKLKQSKIREWNANKSYSAIDLMMNPSEQNYKTWLYYNQDASDKKKETMAKIAGYTPNVGAETDFSSQEDAKERLVELTNMPLDTEADRVGMLDKLTDYVIALNKSNENGGISESDKNDLANMAYKMFDDRAFQEQVHVIFGKPGVFRNIANSVLGASFSKIESIGKETTRNTIQALLNNDPETAQEIYSDGVQRAIRLRYPDIPFDKLKEGDVFWYNSTGKAYKFLGYGFDDILVEVDPNTGAKK